MGDAPSPAQPATVCPGSAPAGISGAAFSCGTARTTASAVTGAPCASVTRKPPSCSGSIAETLVLRATWPPSLASRVAPASPCSSPSGSVGTPMSAALFLPSRPVFTTTAASASEASSPAMFSAETENRSHSARRVRSLCPRLASQSPKRCVSAAGSAGSTKRIASAGRATEARSVRDRNGYRPRAGSICSGPGSAVLRSLAFLPPGARTVTSNRSCSVVCPVMPSRSSRPR